MAEDFRTVGLTIDDSGGDASPYKVRMVLDPAGKAQELTSDDLSRDLTPTLRSARGIVVGDDEVSAETVNEIGVALHVALGDAATAWGQRKWRTDDADETRARILLDVRPSELARLPWEMLFDPGSKVYPFGRADEPAARIAHDIYRPGAERPEREYWPLRILVVVGTHDAKIKALEEVDRMEDALVRLCADIDLEVLDRPPREQLLDALGERRPHILHFIGHGIDAGAGTGALEISPDGQATWDWTATDIRMDLPHKPRLVVVNACRTGGTQAHEGTMSVAQALLEEGVPAVIAMQGPIDGAAAARFSRELYTALADGQPLDVAVVQGRQGIAAPQDVKWSSRQTWLPTLVLGVPPDAVLPPRYRVQSNRASQIRKLVRPLGPFVDRREDRRKILSRLEVRDRNGDDRLFLVTGERLTGKTVLVKWAVAQLAFRGEAAVYVNLGAAKTRPRFLFVMEQIRRALCDALWSDGDDEPLGAFADQLDRLTGATRQATRDEQRELCVELVRALERVSAKSPLVIALDQIEEVFQQDYGELLAGKFLRPVAEDLAGNTRLILVHRATSATVFDELKPVEVAALGHIDARTVRPYVRQYFLYHENMNVALVDAILAAVDVGDKPWLPIQFPQLMQAFGLTPDPQALP
jgi:hypothetical protein